MGDRLSTDKPSRYDTRHPGQLSLAIPLWVDSSLRAMRQGPCVVDWDIGKGVCIAIYGNPSHNYGVSLAIWDHLLSDTSEHTPPLPQPDRLVLDLPTI